jgi:hypothetical protein
VELRAGDRGRRLQPDEERDQLHPAGRIATDRRHGPRTVAADPDLETVGTCGTTRPLVTVRKRTSWAWPAQYTRPADRSGCSSCCRPRRRSHRSSN